MRYILVYSLMFSAMLQLLMASYAWGRRNEPVAKPLIAMFLIGATWAGAYSLDLMLSDLALKLILTQIVFTVASVGPLVNLTVVVEHLELTHLLTRRRLMLALLPSVILVALVWTVQYHDWLFYNFTVVPVGDLDILRWQEGPLFAPIFVILQAFLLVAFYYLIRSFADANSLKRRQSAVILLAFIVIYLSNLPAILNIEAVQGFNFTPHILVISSALFAFAIFRYRWLDILPLARTALVEAIPVGVVVLDSLNRVVDINPSARQILQIPALVAGQETPSVFASLGWLFPPGTESESDKQEVVVKLSDSQARHIEVQAKTLRNQAGKRRGRLVMLQDITERKKKELHLLQLTMAVEQGPDSIVITDTNGVVVYVNPEFTSLTGYAYEQVVGKNPNIVQSGKTPESTYAEMWRTIKSGKVWRGEILNRKKSGELYWDQTVIAPVKDDAGSIVNFVAIQKDITLQKEAQEASRKSESDLREANLQLAGQLEIVNLLQEELRQQATRDPLTGMYNRRYLLENLEREIQRADRKSKSLSVVILDIDHFKGLNDTYGHLAGDACLKAVANLLNGQIRNSDIACRYGGEEFLLALSETDLYVAVQRAEQLRLALSRMVVHHEDREINLTASFGISAYPGHPSNNVDEIIRKADYALYESKRAGRNRVTVWEKGIGQKP